MTHLNLPPELQKKAEELVGITDGRTAEHKLILSGIQACYSLMLADFKPVVDALMVAGNQLHGVKLAIEKHGNNINEDFFITYYGACAGKARAALKTWEAKYGSENNSKPIVSGAKHGGGDDEQ